jgi:two-component system, OmpR family, response regulator
MSKEETKPHVMIVEDARDIREPLARYLREHGYRTTTAADALAARKVMKGAAIDLVVLDIMMPGEDGLSLCRYIRESSQIPVILLTARGEEVDRIIGLEMGADDYLPKGGNPRELLARIRAVLRRAGGPDTGAPSGKGRALEFAGWRLDVTQRQLFSPSQALVPLRAGEFDLLLVLAERPQRVLTRDQLLDLSRGRTANNFDRSIDVQISRIRRKIETDPKEPALIKTVRNGGYILAASVTAV